MIIKANAKINVFLDVLSARNDGYHNLDMVIVPIELHDIIEITKLKESKDSYVVCDHIELKESKYNLITKTINLMKEKFDIPYGFDVKIHKEIPICAGLGGGSSNAAATIKALNEMCKLHLSMEEMIEVGKSLGADIPFCLINEPARVQGIGEQVRPIRLKNKYHVLIIKPDQGLSTKHTFDIADSMVLNHADGDKVERALADDNEKELSTAMFNALEKPAISQIEEIQKIKQLMLNDGFEMVLMSGSGSSVYALSKDYKKAHHYYKKYDKLGYNTILTRTL